MHQSLVAASVNAQSSASLVYVADAGDNAIFVYNNVPNATPTRVITSGISNPQGLAVDGSGNLYVANNGANDVLVFAPGSSTPARTYSQGLSAPSDVAVSSSGEVYVANSLNGDVVVYPPGSSTPSITWQASVANATLLGIALQNPAGGDAYVSYESAGGGGLLLCAIGNATCSTTGISVPGAFAATFQYNTTPLNVLVSDIRNNVVDVFKLRHGTTPASQIHIPASPYGIAFDPGFSHLFVANQSSSGRVNEYHYPTGGLDKSFLPPKSAKTPFLTGVAVYPSTTPPAQLTSNLFVANRLSNGIGAFDTAAGNAALPAITGGGLNSPLGEALSPGGKLFVANPTANSVSVFDTVNGNVLLTTITGGGLNVPTAVALDALGNVYVTNGAGNSISVFTANAYAPATILTGEGSNAFSGPAGIAFKTASFNSGNLLVANAGDNSLGVILLDPDSSAPTGYDYNSVYKLTNLPLNVPQGVTVGPDGSVFFANSGNNSVAVWPGFGVAASTITNSGLDLPEGVAVDASGKLYVTNFGGNSVSVFDTLHGNKLLTTITGGGLDGPTGVVIR